ncbi:solute carrier family 40 member [Anaeramoeba ignava]|uniref:Solute carrier family 40 member n=1 Tax=Anaeramoeba ignava TaxID=1746090 RepID=A0A9Q0L9P8_ANAIG|nr:solute carrier family 40 member [Anaeramoeba ignava]
MKWELKLYSQQFFSAWGDRMWNFAVPMILMEIFETTFLPSSAYELVTHLSVFILSASFGRLIDRKNRLKIATYALWIQNLGVAICSIFLYLIADLKMTTKAEDLPKSGKFWGLSIPIVIIGSLSRITSSMLKVAIEKDWVLVLVGNNEEKLTLTNAWIRRIELSCAVTSPVFFTVVLDQWGMKASILFIAIWNVVSLFPEWILVRMMYFSTPDLKIKKKVGPKKVDLKKIEFQKPKMKKELEQIGDFSEDGWIDQTFTEDEFQDFNLSSEFEKKNNNDDKNENNQNENNQNNQNENNENNQNENDQNNDQISIINSNDNDDIQSIINQNDKKKNKESLFDENEFFLCVLKKGIHDYVRHPVFLASIAYVLLYITVLDFDVLFVAFLVWKKINYIEIGIFRAGNAIFGIIGTLIIPWMIKHMGLLSSGVVSLWVEISFLAVAYVLFFMLSMSHFILLTFVLISRVSLWAFDICEAQIIQLSVSEKERGKISGVQAGLCDLATIIVFILGIIISDPSDFSKLALTSCISVLVAAVLFVIYASRPKNKKYFSQLRSQVLIWKRIL